MNGKEVFICDDEIPILEVLAWIVSSAGAIPITESDSSNLYERLEEGEPKLLIIDLWMPQLSGETIIKKLKSQERFKDLYILCISASRDGEEVAMAAGADQFLAKPFDLHEILAVISTVAV